MRRPFRFQPPDAKPGAVSRPRLLAPLRRRFVARLVTIEAGAGLGKTTVLAQALRENRLDPIGADVWITCEPADSSASVLFGALLDAMGRTPPPEPGVEDVCAAVWAESPTEVCLVLDDAHRIESGSTGEAALRDLLGALPENGHLVIAARKLPALGRSRLELEDRVITFDEDDLRLDQAEVVAFAETHGVAPPMFDGVGGWVALAELRARTGMVEAERYAYEEIVEGLAPDVRHAFLLLVAVGAADVESLGALAGGTIDLAQLAGIPLVASDTKSLRAHPIWQELLAQHMERDFADEARRQLARIMVGRGDPAQAFELLTTTADWEDALAALFAACNAQVRPPYRDQMDRWRAMVPVEFRDRPEVTYAQAMVGRATDPWSDETSRGFDDAIAGFRERGDVVSELTAMIRSSYLGWLRADRAMLDTLHTRVCEMEEMGLPVAPIRIVNRWGVADIECGDLDALPSLDAASLEPRMRHLPGVVRTWWLLGTGDAETAAEVAASADAFGAAVVPAGATGISKLMPHVVAWIRGDIESAAAIDEWDPGLELPFAERAISIAFGALVFAHLGKVTAARRAIERFDELVPELAGRDLLAGFRFVAAAALAVAEGDEKSAASALGELSHRELTPGGAGRALLWFPAVGYLVSSEARAFVDSRPHNPQRQAILDLCLALDKARRDGSHLEVESVPPHFDGSALLAVFPPPVVVEIVARMGAARSDGRADVDPSFLAAVLQYAPDRARDTLRRLSAAPDRALARAAASLLGSVPIPPAAPIRIEVLGELRLLRDGEPVSDPNWRRQRVRQLICALVAHRQIRREALGILLWPDSDDAGVSANLRMTLSYVQTLFEPHRARGDAAWFLRQDAGTLHLVEERLSVDAWEFEDLLDDATQAATDGVPSRELDRLLAALALWHGNYLADVADFEWAEPLRARMHSRLVVAAVRAGDLLVAVGRTAEALAVSEIALAADPYAESAHRVAIRAWLAGGDRDSARRAFERCAARLAELGVPPDDVTQQLLRSD